MKHEGNFGSPFIEERSETSVLSEDIRTQLEQQLGVKVQQLLEHWPSRNILFVLNDALNDNIDIDEVREVIIIAAYLRAKLDE